MQQAQWAVSMFTWPWATNIGVVAQKMKKGTFIWILWKSKSILIALVASGSSSLADPMLVKRHFCSVFAILRSSPKSTIPRAKRWCIYPLLSQLWNPWCLPIRSLTRQLCRDRSRRVRSHACDVNALFIVFRGGSTTSKMNWFFRIFLDSSSMTHADSRLVPWMSWIWWKSFWLSERVKWSWKSDSMPFGGLSNMSE